MTIRQELNGVANPSLPTEERANVAYSLEKGLLNLKRGVAKNFLMMGKVLKEIRDNGYYKELGYDSVSEWLRSPDISLSERWSLSAISIYDTFVNKLDMSFDEVAEIDYSKLYEINSIVKRDPDNAEKWIDAARSMRKVDLIRELQEHRLEERAKLIEPSKKDNNIVLGDAITNLLAMPDDSVDAIITDPPDGDELEFHSRWIQQSYRILKPEGSLVVMCTVKNLLQIASALKDFRLVHTIAWTFDPDNVSVQRLNNAHNLILWVDKGKSVCNVKDVTTDVWQIEQSHEFNHPAEKPEELLERIIELTTLPNQIILDPFLGSGTTAVVADKMERQYRGVEISEFWYKITLERILNNGKH